MSREQEAKGMVVGVKQTRKALLAGHVRQVVLARDAEQRITEPIESLCRDMSVDIDWCDTMAELGRRCHIDVGASVVAYL